MAESAPLERSRSRPSSSSMTTDMRLRVLSNSRICKILYLWSPVGMDTVTLTGKWGKGVEVVGRP